MELFNSTTSEDLNITTEGLPSTSRPRLTVVQVIGDLPNIILVTLGLVLACSSLLCNSLVLQAVWKVQLKELKSKFFLCNILAGDILMPLSYCFPTLVYISVALGMDNNHCRACLDGIKAIFEPIIQYAGAFSSLVMACDRCYAIITSLRYYTKGYSKFVTFCIVLGVWVFSMGLTSPVVLSSWGTSDSDGFCWRLALGHKHWNNVMRFPIVIGVYIAVFVLYLALFILLRARRSVEQISKDIYKTTLRKSFSLALTFFALHFTSLCVFVPGPLFGIAMQWGYVKLSYVNMWRIRHALILLFISNCVIDPYIVATRIPAVKQILCRKWVKKPPTPTSVLSISNAISTTGDSCARQ